jgi:hypothetical protein
VKKKKMKAATENTSSFIYKCTSCNFRDNNDVLAALKAKMEKREKIILIILYKSHRDVRLFFVLYFLIILYLRQIIKESKKWRKLLTRK